ncbi:MAG: class I SAM-dependent methyltransferase [Mariprofundaceae bacterium]|nr:class I SAM-dependent methyltransferase [Mariprofundaceae bacterium]
MPATQLLYQATLDSLHDNTTRAAIINGHADPLLKEIGRQCAQLTILQHFKPLHDELLRLNFSCPHNLEGEFDLILLTPSKNKQQTLGWMAGAMHHLADDARLMIGCANRHGAKSYEAALKKLAGNTRSSSKSKCRIFSARKSSSFNTELARQWINEAQPRRVESHGLVSQPGLFSWEKVDTGSQLLLTYLPADLHGRGMDLCCGYGLLSERLLKTSPDIETLHLADADRLALACAKQNTMPWQDRVVAHWLDAVTEPLPPKLDWIVCNPPFHTGQDQDIASGQSIIANSCKSLKRGGRLYMVANRKLPYEATLDRMLMNHRTVVQEQGFKIIEATKGAGQSTWQRTAGTEGWDYDYDRK